MRKISEIIIHCSDSPFGDVDQIRDWHTHLDKNDPTKPWSDIGYHWLITNGIRYAGDDYVEEFDGLIQAGRPEERQGAHCRGYNYESMGVCLIGPRATGVFTFDQFMALKELIQDLLARYPSIKSIVGHKERENTDCPMFDVQGWLNGVGLNQRDLSGPESKKHNVQ
jgi:hypothetical protein